MAVLAQRQDTFRPSAEFESKYELGELLGRGGFGQVFSCFDKRTGKKVACKVLNREHVRNSIGVEPSKEINIMKNLAGQHYGLIQLVDSFEDNVNCYAVMEFCAGGSLLDILKAHGAMPERGAKVILGQIAAALAYCHSQHVLHLDIKPENIFFAEDPSRSLYGTGLSELASLSSLFTSLDVRARLADFGMATVLKPGKKVRGDVGSPHFKAPEIIGGKKFGLEVDVWSLGVVLSVMLTGSVPFLGSSNHDVAGLNKAIAAGKIEYTSPRWRKVSPEAKDLVSKMLQVDQRERITAAEILEHPWFKEQLELPSAEEEILPAFVKEEMAKGEIVPLVGASPLHLSKIAPSAAAATKTASMKVEGMVARRPVIKAVPLRTLKFQAKPMSTFVQAPALARFACL